jgi:ATPase subunit of ABC transporter with duplicated ATPase domains
MLRRHRRRVAGVRSLEERLVVMTDAVLSQSQTPEAVLVAQGLGKSVSDSTGSLTILRDVDFSIAQGETVAIVGASGSGKSTLLSILAGLDTPSVGTVRVTGQDIFALSEDDRAALRARAHRSAADGGAPAGQQQVRPARSSRRRGPPFLECAHHPPRVPAPCHSLECPSPKQLRDPSLRR